MATREDFTKEFREDKYMEDFAQDLHRFLFPAPGSTKEKPVYKWDGYLTHKLKENREYKANQAHYFSADDMLELAKENPFSHDKLVEEAEKATKYFKEKVEIALNYYIEEIKNKPEDYWKELAKMTREQKTQSTRRAHDGTVTKLVRSLRSTANKLAPISSEFIEQTKQAHINNEIKYLIKYSLLGVSSGVRLMEKFREETGKPPITLYFGPVSRKDTGAAAEKAAHGRKNRKGKRGKKASAKGKKRSGSRSSRKRRGSKKNN
tara:strand:- start:496 stop:1284 length:789 start_codon:yes stop_codon:yes gene_type:complete